MRQKTGKICKRKIISPGNSDQLNVIKPDAKFLTISKFGWLFAKVIIIPVEAIKIKTINIKKSEGADM